MSSKKVFEVLRKIEINGENIVSRGYVGSLAVEGGKVEVVLNIPREMEGRIFDIQDKVRETLLSEGFNEVIVKTRIKSSDVRPPTPGMGTPFSKRKVEGVKNIVAVASGKGGVGKSTVAVNLACALKNLGYSVSLFDADIYGPTISVMLDLDNEKMRVSPDRNKFIPPEKFGLKVVSFGMLVNTTTPILWRGAMFHKAYEELLTQTEWGESDFLIVDLPPGTGDAHLSLCQLFEVSGAVIVTTPQVVSVSDVLRAIKGFEKLDVNVLGIVENMAYFVCPDSGKKFYIFGKGGGERLAKMTGVPLLQSIPIDESVALSGDNGIPIVVAQPNSETSRAFINLAEKVAGSV